MKQKELVVTIMVAGLTYFLFMLAQNSFSNLKTNLLMCEKENADLRNQLEYNSNKFQTDLFICEDQKALCEEICCHAQEE